MKDKLSHIVSRRRFLSLMGGAALTLAAGCAAAPPKPPAPTMRWLMKQLEKHDVGTGATRTSIYADVTNENSKYPLLVEIPDMNGHIEGKISLLDSIKKAVGIAV